MNNITNLTVSGIKTRCTCCKWLTIGDAQNPLQKREVLTYLQLQAKTHQTFCNSSWWSYATGIEYKTNQIQAYLHQIIYISLYLRSCRGGPAGRILCSYCGGPTPPSGGEGRRGDSPGGGEEWRGFSPRRRRRIPSRTGAASGRSPACETNRSRRLGGWERGGCFLQKHYGQAGVKVQKARLSLVSIGWEMVGPDCWFAWLHRLLVCTGYAPFLSSTSPIIKGTQENRPFILVLFNHRKRPLST